MKEETQTALDEIVDAVKDSKNKPVKRTSVRISVLNGLMPLAVLWGLGIVVSQGFWWTVSSIFIPFIGPGTAVYWMVEKFTGGQ